MTTTTKPQTAAAPVFKEGPLPILLSCRVRLNDNQRHTLKQAYYQQIDTASVSSGPRIGASSISATTVALHPLQKKFGSIVISDLLGTRESISLDTVLQIQDALGVEVITPDDVLAAAQSYVTYLFSKYSNAN